MRLLAINCLLCLLAVPVANAADPQPIMPLKEVRIGMTGYGLTVYHGTEIEPFPVRVVSVQNDFGPKHGVIWIECTDERMTKSGPVSGMSGSPIYLWDEGKEDKVGEGGRLIGAFAYGYNAQKICYAGVQPVEYMRETATRVDTDARRADAGGDKYVSLSRTLAMMIDSAKEAKIDEKRLWRLKMLQNAVGEPDGRWKASDLRIAGPDGKREGVYRMSVPVTVGSDASVALLRPMLEPLGMTPVQGTMSGVSAAPPGIDVEKITLTGGSVLSVPLAYGDLDFAGIGTCTEVLPDGRVTGFGHPMIGDGDTSLPLATGYVHMVVNTYMGSFKLGGSGAVVGSIVRDETPAIAGLKDKSVFRSAPMTVNVKMPGHKPKQYNYNIVENRYYMPGVAAILVIESLLADQGLPAENTIRVSGDMHFQGDRKLPLDIITAGGSMFEIYYAVAPAVATMMQNNYEQVSLTRMQVDIEVEAKNRTVYFVGGSLAKNEVAPGEDVSITVELEPYRDDRFEETLKMKVPETLPDGSYQVTVCSAWGYSDFLYNNRYYLLDAENIEDVFEVTKLVNSIKNDKLYMVITTGRTGLALDRQRLDKLPGSKAVLMTSGAHTRMSGTGEMFDRKFNVDYVPYGMLTFNFNVKRDLKD